MVVDTLWIAVLLTQLECCLNHINTMLCNAKLCHVTLGYAMLCFVAIIVAIIVAILLFAFIYIKCDSLIVILLC